MEFDLFAFFFQSVPFRPVRSVLPLFLFQSLSDHSQKKNDDQRDNVLKEMRPFSRMLIELMLFAI
jgi:hypothetical protein